MLMHHDLTIRITHQSFLSDNEIKKGRSYIRILSIMTTWQYLKKP